jgi:mRNA deadenylase 3'-5' endonuclease subunit Ccr4
MHTSCAPTPHARPRMVARAGDFNCAAGEGVYRYLQYGRLEGGYAEPVRPRDPVTAKTVCHPFLLVDVYAQRAAFAQPFTYGRPDGCSTIDFIWASESLVASGVLQALEPAAALKVAAGGVPNATWPSDHLPLGAVLQLRHDDDARAGPAPADGA